MTGKHFHQVITMNIHEPAIDKFKMVLWHFRHQFFQGHIMRGSIFYDSASCGTYKFKNSIQKQQGFEKMCLWVFILMTFSALAWDSRILGEKHVLKFIKDP